MKFYSFLLEQLSSSFPLRASARLLDTDTVAQWQSIAVFENLTCL